MKRTPSHTEKKWLQHPFPQKWNWFCPYWSKPYSAAMATPTISANENTPTTNEPSNRNTTSLTQPLTDATNIAGKNESDFSSPRQCKRFPKENRRKTCNRGNHSCCNSLRFSTTKPDKIVQVSQLLLLVQQRLKLKQKSPSKTTTSVSMSKNFLKKTRMLKDSGLGTMLKNLLKTGLTEPCPSRMPKKMTMATTQMSN